jgi:hypothetical protein
MATDPDDKRQRRLAARAERERIANEGRRRAKRNKTMRLLGFVIAAVAVIAAGGLLLMQTANKTLPGRPVPDEGRDHVPAGSQLTFKSNLPASGTHYEVWARPGVYTEAVAPGLWVHSLEHGYVAILYNCPSACPDLQQQLRQFYDSAPPSARYKYQKLVITPYQNMEHRIAAVAWDRVDEMDDFDADRLMTFYKAFLDKGPEDAS